MKKIYAFSFIFLLVLQPILIVDPVFADDDILISNEITEPEILNSEIISEDNFQENVEIAGEEENLFEENIQMQDFSQDQEILQPKLLEQAEVQIMVPESFVYISKIYAKDGVEFIEIYNSGDDLRVENFSVYKTTSSKDTEIASFNAGIFKAKSSVLIHQKTKDFNPVENTGNIDYDAYYTANLIAQSNLIKMKINDFESNFCSGSACVSTERDISELKDDFLAEICFDHENFENNCTNSEVKNYFKNTNISGTKLYFGGFVADQKKDENNENSGGEPEIPKNSCDNFRLNEIAANVTNQFVEIVNSGETSASLGGCKIQTNRNSKIYIFGDVQLEGGEIISIEISETDLTLTKTTKGKVYFLSEADEEVDAAEYENLKAETSWSRFEDIWKQTYAVTQNEANIFTEFAPCEAGYERNLETGKCKKIVTETELATCAVNQYRNPETGRCKKYETEAVLAACAANQYRNPETGRCKKYETASTLAACAADQYRNPETNRCKKISTASAQLTPCKEGYERNLETNRCRKVVSNTGANEALTDENSAKESQFMGWITLAAISSIAAVIVIYEFRNEIWSFLLKTKNLTFAKFKK